MDEYAVQQYFDWINERHAIYIRKEIDKEPWPWTDDPIFQQYRFANVFRELDKVTIWLRENWLEPFADHHKLYFNIAVARQFNWPDTLKFIGYSITQEEFNVISDNTFCDNDVSIHILSDEVTLFDKVTPWEPRYLTKDVELLQAQGHKIFTGAYMIRGQCINPSGREWTSKAQYMFHQVLDPVWHAPEPEWETLQQAWTWWQQFEGFGPFLAYEIVTDMRHTRYLRDAPDIMTWANAGPGAMRGIHRLMGWHAKHTAQKQQWYNEQMQLLLELSDQYLMDHVPALEMRDIEHTLCEFDKYWRVRNGEGKPRAKYKHN